MAAVRNSRKLRQSISLPVKFKSVKSGHKSDDAVEVVLVDYRAITRQKRDLLHRIYREGIVLAAVDYRQAPPELHSIWIGPALHKALILEDESSTAITLNTKVNGGVLLAENLVDFSKVESLLFGDRNPCIVLTRQYNPVAVVLPPDAIDRIPAVVVAMVTLRRGQPKAPARTADAPFISIEDEIEHLVRQADGGRKSWQQQNDRAKVVVDDLRLLG